MTHKNVIHILLENMLSTFKIMHSVMYLQQV